VIPARVRRWYDLDHASWSVSALGRRTYRAKAAADLEEPVRPSVRYSIGVTVLTGGAGPGDCQRAWSQIDGCDRLGFSRPPFVSRGYLEDRGCTYDCSRSASCGRQSVHVLSRPPVRSPTGLTHLIRQFVERSPFVCVATTRPDGGLDVSAALLPAPASFARILDSARCCWPERPVNRIADTLTNLLHYPRTCWLFLIPGVGDRLRVNGSGW